MIIPFSKYQGTGNDFILIDNRTLKWTPTQEEVFHFCDRHFGIGADGLMLLEEKPGFDFSMIYYNSDGRESTMCGNGGRCMTLFANSLGLIGSEARFYAIDGEHVSEIIKVGTPVRIRVKMKDTEVTETGPDHVFLDTGSPHYVIFRQDVAKIDIVTEARKIRYNERFWENGTNVDFVEVFPDHLFVRSYERGVENETLSCGTGVTASVLAVALTSRFHPTSMEVETPGGSLQVSYRQKGNFFTDVWLEGAAEFVFKGEIAIGEK
ncbi:MAG: diaminopimelate epimerase [Bacteroidetes bacterium]|nr:diaminopimelate epimerase [Bacteroidota bacterium]